MTALAVTGADLVEERLDQLFAAAHADDRSFWAAQFDLGLAWVGFPVGLGGLGVDPALQEVVDRRLAAHGAPDNLALNFIGIQHMAPTVLEHARPELRQQLLRAAFTCDDIWCQLFSEPGAGSDLASLATTAELDGDEWVVNGQKVWTTLAHIARWGLLLARTDVDAPKHRGLTYFIVDLHAPGVEVRPLRQLTGDAEYNEVFLTDVRIPDGNRLSPVGGGWRTAMSTLLSERTAVEGIGNSGRAAGPIDRLLGVFRSAPPEAQARHRDAVTQLWIESEALRLTRLRSAQLRRDGRPGPEGSIGKVAVALLHQRVLDRCMALRGPTAALIDGYEMVQPTILLQISNHDRDLTRTYLTFLGLTIGGGTTEVNKTLIGERVLGLPPEPRHDLDQPWSQARRSRSA